MAAQNSLVLENHVKLFVETKVGENVILEFSNNCVYVRPSSKRGSTTLGTFWVRVLQSYFPKDTFAYKRHYSAVIGSEALTIDVDDYSITVYLRTGLLTVEGQLAHEWFRIIFRKIMDRYDKLTSSNPADYFNEQVIFDIRKQLQKPKNRPVNNNTIEAEVVDGKTALVCTDIRLPEQRVKFLDERRLSFEGTESGVELSLIPQREIPTCGMGTMALKDGERYVYPMWKQLLNKWLSKEHCQVFICTKHIDVDRLRDVVNIAYKNRLVMNLDTIYTDPVARNGQHMTQVKQSLLKGHPADEQLFIEYKIINKMVFPVTKSISCNFIAGVQNGVVELMTSSATFDYEGIVKPNNLSTVTLTKMLLEDFQSNFIDKLATI